MKEHHDTLYPRLKELWEENGTKASGTWEDLFGRSAHADEIFMAWHYAKFIQAVTARGKRSYDIPMFVNTWLDGAQPGQFPSGGPEPWVMDVWRAAGSAIDVYSPDLYAPNFVEWCQRYHREGNPLFMPETRGGKAGAANVFYVLGEEAGFGFSPFAIEDATDPQQDLAVSYRAIASVMPVLAEHQAAGDVHGFLLTKEHPEADFTMDRYQVHVSLDQIFTERSEGGYGLVMGDGPDRFLGVGRGFRVWFTPVGGDKRGVGIGTIDEGEFVDGRWAPGRRLNGDENDQGAKWQFDERKVVVERVQLYRFE